MKRNLLITLFAVTLVIATVAFAQQGSGPVAPPAGPPSVLSGTVVSFNAGTGMGAALVLGVNGSETTLLVGPIWFLQKAGFTATAGDIVEATVLACPQCRTGNAVVAVKNLTNGTAVTLRNAEGVPLWMNGPGNAPGNAPGNGRGNGPGAGPGNGPGNGPGQGYGTPANGSGPAYGNGPGRGGRGVYGRGNTDCAGIDMTQLATVHGSVKAFTGGQRTGQPSLVLLTADGEKTYLVAPYRMVLDAGLEFVEGASFTLTAAPNTTGAWVVVTLHDDATGIELVLRDATGFPVGGRCGTR